ncbi:hypothetical protein ABT381_01225 [Streptomyces sp. NPDC000151]|uniref:hypothetical protein n=1 Tax=Streptomyces sp. NPDC000151 TaxID=3154244 RepID=UPI00331EB8C4
MEDSIAREDRLAREDGLAMEQDASLAVFVGRQFAAALHEGLRRAQLPQRAGPRPVPERPAAPRMTRGGALLAEHAHTILARFDEGLATVPDLDGPARATLRAGLAVWARQVIDSVTRPGRTARPARYRTVGPAHRPTARPHVLAVSLLIESAVIALPGDAPATPEALRTLARAVRTPGLGLPGGA